MMKLQTSFTEQLCSNNNVLPTDNINRETDRLVNFDRLKKKNSSISGGLFSKKKKEEEEYIKPTEVHQFVCSARLGNRSKIWNSDSDDSIETDISLLHCSINKENGRNKRRKKKCKLPPKPQSSKWISISRRAHVSLLDKLMKVDTTAGHLASYMTDRAAPVTNMWQAKDEQEEAMEYEERNLLHQCAKVKGLAGKQKSKSTVTLNVDPKPNKSKTKIIKPLRRSQSLLAEYENLGLVHTSKPFTSSEDVHNVGGKRKSPVSNKLKFGALSAGRKSLAESGATKEQTPLKITKLVHSIMGLDLDQRASNRARRKIKQTIEALDRLTGYGADPQIKNLYYYGEQDSLLYTQEDFARMPYYPQRVKVAPHLAKIIKDDIKLRMGRPKYHEITKRDLEDFDKGTELNKAHRNLMIFNWLISLEDEHFENYQNLTIVDPAEEERRLSREKLLKKRLSSKKISIFSGLD